MEVLCRGFRVVFKALYHPAAMTPSNLMITTFVLLVVGCSSGEGSTSDPTADTPILRSGEVIGLIQDFVSRQPGCEGNLSLIGIQTVIKQLEPEYLGDGVWKVGYVPPDDGKGILTWEVFDRTRIVRSTGALC